MVMQATRLATWYTPFRTRHGPPMYKTSPHVISFHGENYDKIIIRWFILFFFFKVCFLLRRKETYSSKYLSRRRRGIVENFNPERWLNHSIDFPSRSPSLFLYSSSWRESVRFLSDGKSLGCKKERGRRVESSYEGSIDIDNDGWSNSICSSLFFGFWWG